MYAVPIHALRFAAHCRARLRFVELSPAEISRSSAIAGVARFWIRLAPHTAHANAAETCARQRLPRLRS